MDELVNLEAGQKETAMFEDDKECEFMKENAKTEGPQNRLKACQFVSL